VGESTLLASAPVNGALPELDVSAPVNGALPELDVSPPVNGALPDVKVLTPDDWRMLRTARLAALEDSPHAFTSSYDRESKWEDLKWQRSLTTSTWVVACDGQNVIGLAKSIEARWRPASRYVESVWVAPTHRRRGVLGALLYTLAETCRPMGVTELRLWVLLDNRVAINAYRALRFVAFGKPHRLRVLGPFEQQFRFRISGETPTAEPARRASLLVRFRIRLGTSPDR
jgi:GNAT superfamily N-acetyltransferase